MKSKYGPGGEFDPDWYVLNFEVRWRTVYLTQFAHTIFRKPPGGDSCDHPHGSAPIPIPEQVPVIISEEPKPSAWRNVQQRKRSKRDAQNEVVALEPGNQLAPRTANSWVSWKPNPHLVPSPPPEEPTPMLVVPERSPGLFGPRSPRDSLLP